jgi:hypothetical protein
MMDEEKSWFVKVFGDYPIIKVIDFFLTFKDFDYSLTDIAKNASVGWATLNAIFPDLVRNGIVQETRQIGRAKLYRLNVESPIVRELVELDVRISKHFNDELIAQQKKAVEM